MILRRLWRGDLPLGEAFWTWAVLGELVVNLTTIMVSLWIAMAGHALVGFVAGHAVSLPYNLVAAVGVWRSAARADADPRWAGSARLAVVIGMTILSLV